MHKTHNLQRGILPIIVIIVIVAGVATVGGGYYAVSKKRASNAKSPSARVNTSTSAPSKATTVAMQEVTLKVSSGDETGWPIKVSSSAEVNGSVQSFAGMSVLKIMPIVSDGSSYTIIVSGLPANTDLYVYTQGYRVEEIKRTSAGGTLNFTLNTPQQFIIKATKS